MKHTTSHMTRLFRSRLETLFQYRSNILALSKRLKYSTMFAINAIWWNVNILTRWRYYRFAGRFRLADKIESSQYVHYGMYNWPHHSLWLWSSSVIGAILAEVQNNVGWGVSQKFGRVRCPFPTYWMVANAGLWEHVLRILAIVLSQFCGRWGCRFVQVINKKSVTNVLSKSFKCFSWAHGALSRTMGLLI